MQSIPHRKELQSPGPGPGKGQQAIINKGIRHPGQTISRKISHRNYK